MAVKTVVFLFNCFLYIYAAPGPNMQIYLMKYGYMEPPNTKTGQIRSRQSLESALKRFQRFANIPTTGIFDDDTKKKMQQPRCGLPDVIGSSDSARRKRRYALQGSRWPKTALTYGFENFGDDLTSLDVRKAFQTAKTLWSNAAKITLTEVQSNPDIEVKFAKGNHGDGDPFDGPGGTLAHAFFPQYGGNLHFDDSETYTVDNRKPGATDLLQVTVHELGHSLGLSHSDVKGSIMAPYYAGYTPNLNLHQDDINGIQHMYGKRKDSPDSVVPTMPNAAKGAPDKCKTTLDAALRAPDGHVYIFKGSYVWKLGDRGIEPGFPQRIQNIWKELPNDLDAALGWRGYLYFFKGSRYWAYLKTNLRDGYPRSIGVLGLPDNIDSAFIWGGNGRLYFTKGNMYYRLDRQSNSVAKGYPKTLSVWRGLPAKVDAAVLDPTGRTQFFSGNVYYRFNDNLFRVQSGYPQSMNKYWLGCESAYVKITNSEKKNSTCPCTCGSAATAQSFYGSVLVSGVVTLFTILRSI